MQDQRVISNTTDISSSVINPVGNGANFAYVAGQYLYVGQPTAFNSLWLEFDSAHMNVVSSAPTIEIWFGNAWVSVVDLIDQTSNATASGRLSWNTDRLKGWDYEQTSEDVTGISSFKIYWKYWARISFASSFTSGTVLKYVGQKFSSDEDLFARYPDLNNADLMDSFEVDKDDWDLQHFVAADDISRDLRARGIIKNKGQIVNWNLLNVASIHKVAEIIYRGLQRPYFDQMQQAGRDYKAAMNIDFYDIDKSGNGSLEPGERQCSAKYGSR